MMNHIGEHKFKLKPGIRDGTRLFLSILPFGLGLLVVTTSLGLMIDWFLPDALGKMVMTLVIAMVTGAFLIKVKDKLMVEPDTLMDVLKELKKRMKSLLAGGVILILMSLSIKFYLMLVIPWSVMFDALDILYAILFMFLYHGIIIGNDVAIEAVSNSYEAYLENKSKVLLMGLGIILWSVLLMLPPVTGNPLLYFLLQYVLTPIFAGYLLCINAFNYVQMIKDEPFS